MAMARSEETESVSYWIVADGRNFKTRTPIGSKWFGPYASEQEAERAMPGVLIWDDIDDHVYWFHIEAEPGTQPAT